MKSYFKTLLISLFCTTVSLPFAAQTTVAQTTTPKPEDILPSSQPGIKLLRSLDAKSHNRAIELNPNFASAYKNRRT